MKRALVLVLALILVIGTASLALAGDTSTRSPNRVNVPQLQISDAQKAKLTSLWTQIFEVKKEILKDNLKNGVINQDQYNAMEERMNTRLEDVKSGKITPGMGRGGHKGMGRDKARCLEGGTCWRQPQTQS